jgi:5'-3' exonuclease
MVHPRQLADKLIGARVFVWPSLTEALVVSCCDAFTLWRLKQPEQKISGKLSEDFRVHLLELGSDARTTKAVGAGDVKCVLGVRMFQGMKRAPDGSIRRSYEKEETEVLPQLCVLKRLVDDPRHTETPAPTIQQAYPLGTPVVYIGPEFYGCSGVIKAHEQGHTVQLALQVAFPTPNFGHPIR